MKCISLIRPSDCAVEAAYEYPQLSNRWLKSQGENGIDTSCGRYYRGVCERLDVKLETSGFQTVVLEGTGFGVDSSYITVMYGPIDDALKYTAQNCRITTSHKVIECETVKGTGQELQWQIIVAGQPSGISPWFTTTYKGPEITAVWGPGSENARTAGGDALYIEGRSFGPKDEYVSFFYGGSDADRFAATGCVVTVEDSQITCFTAVGTGVDSSRIYSKDVDSQIGVCASTIPFHG